jgi:serine/threonine-protein kinase
MDRNAVTVPDASSAPSGVDGAREATASGRAEDPDTIGRFSVLRRLGEGGMGVVLVGRDDTLERDVALKLVRPERADAAARTRLLREAQAMARVAHPNVVAIYEAGLHADSSVYIAMELVAGKSLAEWLTQKRPVRDVLEVFVQAGRGLAAAHHAGILHRDFKPANVLVGDDGRARVVDFGLARAVATHELAEVSGAAGGSGASRASDASTTSHASPTPHAGVALAAELTVRGTILGTPAYMSPEHFKGEATEASDQWSFGVSLYRALFGAAPFAGEGLLGLMEAVVKGPAPSPPPSPDVPPRVTAIVLRALERDAADRFPSMDAMVDALEAELRVDPAKDPAASRRQRRAVAIVVTMFGVASLVVLGVRSGFHLSVRDVMVQALLGLTVLGAAVLAFRRRLLRDAHGRRVVVFFVLMIATLAAHRAVSLDADVAVVLRGDAVFAVTMGVLAGAMLERWLGWVAVVMSAYLAFSYAAPSLAVAGFGTALIGCIALGIWFWREPAAPLLAGDRSRSGSRGGARSSGARARPKPGAR